MHLIVWVVCGWYYINYHTYISTTYYYTCNMVVCIFIKWYLTETITHIYVLVMHVMCCAWCCYKLVYMCFLLNVFQCVAEVDGRTDQCLKFVKWSLYLDRTTKQTYNNYVFVSLHSLVVVLCYVFRCLCGVCLCFQQCIIFNCKLYTIS